MQVLDINALMLLAVAGAIAIGEHTEGAAVVVLFAVAAWLEEGTQLPFTKSSWHTAGQQVPADQLVNGSVLLMKPGVGVPEDGVIVSGAS